MSGSNSISENRSTLKEFLASIATIKGDLSNITAPPFVLASQSTVEIPAYWCERPSLFVAPASEPDPARRALLVLRWYLTSLKQQQYAGRDPADGVKKPLNAFLGEVFVADWKDEKDQSSSTTIHLISEQVSHHPPVTACYLYSSEAGIRAEGYTCQEINFSATSASVSIAQIGHAIVHIDAYDEDYLVPLPNVRVKGVISGTPYPELNGTYHIVSSSGYTSSIDFSGKTFLGIKGKQNTVDATLFKTADKSKTPIYTVTGQWNSVMTIHDGDGGKEIETLDVTTMPVVPLLVPPVEQQDPWESRRAWHHVHNALANSNMQGVVDEKSKIENAQRELRKLEEKKGVKWEPLFFRCEKDSEQWRRLAEGLDGEEGELRSERTVGVWRYDEEKSRRAEKPWHGRMGPAGGVL